MHDEHPVTLSLSGTSHKHSHKKQMKNIVQVLACLHPCEVATTEADSAVQFFEDFAHYLYHVPKRRTLCMSTELEYTCLNR